MALSTVSRSTTPSTSFNAGRGAAASTPALDQQLKTLVNDLKQLESFLKQGQPAGKTGGATQAGGCCGCSSGSSSCGSPGCQGSSGKASPGCGGASSAGASGASKPKNLWELLLSKLQELLSSQDGGAASDGGALDAGSLGTQGAATA